MIEVTVLRKLFLQAPISTGRPAHFSAASGLVAIGDWLYIVADDELHLGVFPRTGNAPGELVRIFPGELPPKKKERKAAKPDLEALTCLPPFVGHPHGALLALASGSKLQRQTGALLSLNEYGAVVGTPRLIDLSGIYGPLATQFPALNIEGAVVMQDQLRLLHRGKETDDANAVIALSLAEVLQALGTSDSIGVGAALAIQRFDLGRVNDIPLAFTDGAALPDGSLLFTAVAENSKDNYADGPCAGAVIGIIGADGQQGYLEPLPPGYKVEGIAATVEGDTIRLLLVTDADDANIPGYLLSAEIRGYRFSG